MYGHDPRMTKRTRTSSHTSKLDLTINITSVGVLVVYVLLYFWYAQTVIPTIDGPVLYNNFFWGFLHGIFAVPDFIYSLFNENIAIYQAGNGTSWYDLGFLIGIGALARSLTR